MTTSNLGSMTGTTDARLRSPEVANRLGISGRDVYRLIFSGDLDGRPDADGIVFVTETSVVAYLVAHGIGNVSSNLSNEPRRTGPDGGGPTAPETGDEPHEHGRRRMGPDVLDRDPWGS